jgi:uncharacterized protein YoxC
LGNSLPSLSSGELAFNEINRTLYYGASSYSVGISAIPIGGDGAFTTYTYIQSITSTFGNSSALDALSAEVKNLSTDVKTISAEVKSLSAEADNKFLLKSGGKITGDLTIYGDLSATGTSYFANTIYTTTSALSIINVNNNGPALYVGNNGTGDLASFYDLDTNTEVFHIGGANGSYPNVGVKTSTPNKDFTVNGEISASGNIWTSGNFISAGKELLSIIYPDINLGISSYTTVKANSSNWNSVYNTVNPLSSNWNSVYTSTNNTSGSWDSVYNTVNPLSSNWNSVYSNVQSNSANAISVYSSVNSLSGNWNSVYTSTNNTSGNWNSVYNTVNPLSGSWNSVYSNVQSNSANAISVYSSVNSVSGNWNSAYTSTRDTSGNWNSVYNTVNPLSSNWNTSYTNLVTNSAAYLSGYDLSFLSVSGNWNSVYTSTRDNSGSWNSVYNTVNPLSGNWNSVYTNVNVNSGSYATINYADSKFFPISGGNITGPTKIQGNLTVYGDLSATGNSYFFNTVYSTTSALSVVNIGNTGPALYVGNNGTGDIASFYDIDSNIEVFHIGGANGTFPNVGVKTSTPNKDFTVNGEISANNTIYDISGNSNQWNSVYNTVISNSAINWNYQGTDIKDLSANWVGGNIAFTNLISNSAAYLSGSDLSFLSVSGNWNSVYTSVKDTSANWNASYTNLVTNSAAYLSGYDLSFLSVSANWNSVYDSVNSLSGNWNSTYTSVLNISANWESTYTTVQNTSANWDSVYTNVNSYSATYATYNYVDTNFLNLTGGIIDGNLSVLSSFKVGGGSNVLFASGGKVGIKTELPIVELTVNGSISASNKIYGTLFDWMTLVRGYKTTPTLLATIGTGEVYTYVFATTGTDKTYYRYIATDGSEDSFYGNFSNPTLSNLITTKKIIL